MNINGWKVFESLVEDVREYYSIDIGLEVDLKTNLNKGYFSSTILNGKRVILLHKDAAYKVVEDKQDFLYYLFIFCHELAHCINGHNTWKDEENIDSKAIEAWADYSSTLFGFEIFYYGKNTKEISKIFFGEKPNLNEVLFYTAKTIVEIYQTIFSDSDTTKYPLPSSRFHLIINGVSAFFCR